MTCLYTVPNTKTARNPVLWLLFHASAELFPGDDADRFRLRHLRRSAADKSGNLAPPPLAQALGGSADRHVFLAAIGAIVFAEVLAIVASSTLAFSGAIPLALYVSGIRRGQLRDAHRSPCAPTPSAPLLASIAVPLSNPLQRSFASAIRATLVAAKSRATSG